MFGLGKNKKCLEADETKSKRKKIKSVLTTTEKVLDVCFRPELLLQDLFFLNCDCSKSVSIGYDVEDDCRPKIILTHNQFFVVFSFADWLAFFLSGVEIQNWFYQVNETVSTPNIVLSKNLNLRKFNLNGEPIIQIQNSPLRGTNNELFLNAIEFDKCNFFNTHLQYIFRQKQANWIHIDDYYNLYVYYCLLKNKTYLEDEDYFTFSDTNINSDTYKIFQEIRLVCGRKLAKDLSIAKK